MVLGSRFACGEASHKFYSQDAAGFSSSPRRSPPDRRRPASLIWVRGLTCLWFWQTQCDGSHYGSSACCKLVPFHIKIVHFYIVHQFTVGNFVKGSHAWAGSLAVLLELSVINMCSLHLKAFWALRIVSCHNNGLVVYSWGSSDALSPLSASRLCLQRKNNYGITTRTILEKKKVKTHYLYYCPITNAAITTHCSIWLQICFLGQCVWRVSKLLSRTKWLINKCPYGQPGPSTV